MNNTCKVKIKGSYKYIIKYLQRKDIPIYKIDYEGEDAIFIISKSDLDKVPECYIESVKNNGLIGIIDVIKRDYSFFIGYALSLIITFLASFIIIDIDIVHSSSKIRNIIREELSYYGVRSFSIKKSYSKLESIKKKIKEDYKDNIEWLEIIDEGMKYTVRVEERIITKEKKEEEFCNIVSTKDAIVKNINIEKGQILADVDDYVSVGSTIISGAIVFNEEVKNYVCSKGEVIGNTWYKVNVNMPLDYIEKDYTGKKKHNIMINYGSNSKEIFNNHLKYYDKDKKRIFKINKFTIYLETLKEYKPIKKRYSEKNALKKALKLSRKNLKIKLGKEGTINSEKVLQSNTYNSIISVDVFYSALEPIGKVLKMNKEEYVKEGLTNDITE